jgi:hypothetical protein
VSRYVRSKIGIEKEKQIRTQENKNSPYDRKSNEIVEKG